MRTLLRWRDSWPYNGLQGFLLSLVGDCSVTIYDVDSSIAMGNNMQAWLEEQSKKVMSRNEKKQLLKPWATITLKEKTACWIPFGFCHSVIPLQSQRESLLLSTDGDKPGGSTKKKAKPGKAKAGSSEAEYSSLLLIPVLGSSDENGAPQTVCSTYARFLANKPYAPAGWEGQSVWQGYCKRLAGVASRTNNKKETVAGGSSIPLSVEELASAVGLVGDDGDSVPALNT